MVAVRWYLRYGLSYRDVEEFLAERGISVDHVTIYRWVQRFTPLLIDAARPCRHAPKDRWFVEETSVTVAGRWVYLDRAIDQDGQVIETDANNPVEADHGRLTSRPRPMRGLTRLRCARVVSAGHAFVQNIRRGHDELGTEEPPTSRVMAAFTELVMAI
jgi:transposase-like protein